VTVGFDSSVCDILRKPLQEHSRRGPGGSYSYHKGSDVIRRLNEAFGHAWSSERLEERVIDDQVLILVSIYVVNKDGDTVTHQGYGSAQIARHKGNSAMIDLGNSYKSAYTNALKKAAEQFGIGLGDDEDAVTKSNSSSAPRAAQSPPRAPMQAPAAMPVRTPMASPAPLPARMAAGGTRPQAAPPVITQDAIDQVLDQAQASVGGPSPAVVSPAPDLTNLAISDTQLRALTNLARMKGLDEKTLVQSAGYGDKRFKDLNRTEAMMVIKHTNTLPQG